MLEGVRFVGRDMLPNQELIRNADVVWIQGNSLSHASYYKIIQTVRKSGVPIRYFGYAGAEKCAEQLARYDMK